MNKIFVRNVEKTKLWYRAWRYRLKHDRAEISYILKSIQPGNTVVDIGAHKGAYTYWLRKRVGTSGKVISFEPQPELAKYLTDMVGLYKWKNVSVENSGLSSEIGQMTLHIPSHSPSPGATFEKKFSARDVVRTHSVEVTTLDEYVNRNIPKERITFIKCDVEGHEFEVFKGAENILRDQKPILMFECEQRHHKEHSIYDIFNYLNSMGYKGFFFIDGKIRPLNEFSLETHQAIGRKPYINNFLFT